MYLKITTYLKHIKHKYIKYIKKYIILLNNS